MKSLAAELAGDAAPAPRAEPTRVHRLMDDDEAAAGRARSTTRAPKRNGEPPRFGVFEDGSVAIELPNCKGRLTGEEARVLVEFVQRLGARI